MHSNYILSPELKAKVEAVPSSSEFGTEHADLVAEHEQFDVKNCFKNSLELSGEMKSYSAGLIHHINTLLESGSYPSWLLGGMVDSLGSLKSGEVSGFTRKIRTSLNDIALATAHFFTDDLLYDPKERICIDYRNYGFETELDFIMSMSAYGISGVKSLGGNHKSKEWISDSGYKIEISSCGDHDPRIIFKDQRVGNVLSPFGNLVDFRPETIDRYFQFSQQTEPNILGSLFSYITSQVDIRDVFGEDGEELKKLFGHQANHFRLNKDCLHTFMKNSQTPINKLGDKIKFSLDLEHRVDGCIFLINESNKLEFRKCVGSEVGDEIIFSLNLNDAIILVKNILFLINKQSTFRTMPRTGYAFVNKYFHELGN